MSDSRVVLLRVGHDKEFTKGQSPVPWLIYAHRHLPPCRYCHRADWSSEVFRGRLEGLGLDLAKGKGMG